MPLLQHHDKAEEMVKRGQHEFKTMHVPVGAGGQQVERAALRFAMAGVAGELATVWDITGRQ